MSEEIRYLTGLGLDVLEESSYEIEKGESKGGRRRFFKVDAEGFIYSTYERPNGVVERDYYDE